MVESIPNISYRSEYTVGCDAEGQRDDSAMHDAAFVRRLASQLELREARSPYRKDLEKGFDTKARHQTEQLVPNS